MIVPRRLKAIVWIDKYEISTGKPVLHPGEPFAAYLWALSNRPVGGDTLIGEDSARKDVSSFECPHIPLTRRHDLVQSIEQVRVESPPLCWPVQISNMASVIVMAFIREAPPCDAQAVPRRQSTQDAELEIVSDVSDVAVQHGQMIAMASLSCRRLHLLTFNHWSVCLFSHSPYQTTRR